MEVWKEGRRWCKIRRALKIAKITCRHFERFQCFNAWCSVKLCSLWRYLKTQCLVSQLQTPCQHLVICGKFIGVCYLSFKWERLFKSWKSSFNVPKDMYFSAFPSFWILLLPLPSASCTLFFGKQSLTCHWGDSLHAKSLKHKHTSGTDSPQCASKCGKHIPSAPLSAGQ